MKLWGGRFSKDLTTDTEGFTESIEVDSRMVLHDIWGSEAHAIMLAKQQIISIEDLEPIITWLNRAKEDFLTGNFQLKPELEDVHMNVETYLIEGAGREYGGKLHTARSRNDQVLVDARLYIREQLLTTHELLSQLIMTFLNIAREHFRTVMPGYTHTQHAQPITLAFWATAYASMFLRDLERLERAYERVNVNPLGSCALAGTSLPTDRQVTTKLLGFASTQEHALDIISARDFITETLFALSQMMANFSRIAEEIVYWSTYEFHMLTLDDAYALGSSIMPQKKNPCVAELTRGRVGHVYGNLLDMLTTLKGLPMGYNRDLQEDKPPLWAAFDTTQACANILTGTLCTAHFHTDRMAELVSANFSTATELANYLVQERHLAFRECHEIVGDVVGRLVQSDKDFRDLEATHSLLSEHGIDMDIETLTDVLDPISAIERNQSLGGTSPAEVERMEAISRECLQTTDIRRKTAQEDIERARQLTDQITNAVRSKQLDQAQQLIDEL